MQSVFLKQSLVDELNGVSLVIGQTLQSDTYAYQTITLGEYSSLDLNDKTQFATFLNEIQDLTIMVSYGMKSLGFIFDHKREYLDNLSILRKITRAINNSFMIFGYLGELSHMLRFDLQTLKITKIPVQIVEHMELQEYNTALHLQINSLGINNIMKKYEKSKFIIDGQVVFQEKESLVKFAQVQDIQFLKPQTEESSTTNQEETSQIVGTVYLTVMMNPMAKISDLRALFLEDLQDTLMIRCQDLPKRDQNLQRRIKFYIKDNIIPYQDYFSSDLTMNEVSVHLQQKLDRLSKCSLDRLIFLERFEVQQQREDDTTTYEDHNIDLQPNPNVSIVRDEVEHKNKHGKLLYQLLLVVVILVGIILAQLMKQ